MLLIRHGSFFFFTYLVIGVGLLVAIATPFNEGFARSVSWNAVPILVISIVFTRIYMPGIRRLSHRSPKGIWFYTFLTAGVLTFMSWPYALLANATIGSRNPIQAGGTVIEKFENRSRSTTYVLVTWSHQLNREVRMVVPEATFNSANVGDNYIECFYQGSLGFLYRWRYSDSKPNCSGRQGAA